MKRYKAKSVILACLGLFRGFLTPFGALGTQREFFRKKFLYSAQLDMKIQIAAKFHKKNGYRALGRTHARTHGRTDATENNGALR